VTPAFALGVNGSFEDGINPGVFVTLPAGNTNITDWTVESGSIDYIGSYWTAQSGVRSIDLNGLVEGAISQTLSTVPGMVYTVDFYLSGNPDSRPESDPLYSPELKEVEVLAEGSMPIIYSFDTAINGNTHQNMMWDMHSYSFLATDNTTKLTISSKIGGAFGPALDNVSIDDGFVLSKEMCKEGGWENYGIFKNQGDCVSYVATQGKNLPANIPVAE